MDQAVLQFMQTFSGIIVQGVPGVVAWLKKQVKLCKNAAVHQLA